MAFRLSRRAFTSIAFLVLFVVVAGDAIKQANAKADNVVHQVSAAGDDAAHKASAVASSAIQQAKGTSVHAFDQIKDKISITAEDIQTLLHLSSQKELDSKKSRSWTTFLFGFLFPSSRPAINALLATAYISGPPNFLLALCPPNIDPASLSIMVAFAVGGLLGDTFFHLLPEIFLGEDDSETKIRMVLLEPNRNLLLGVFIFVGLATFMAMDKALRIATGAAHSHEHDGKPKEHKHKHIEKFKNKAKKHLEMQDYRLTDNLQELAKEETREETAERLYNKPYNDTSVNGRKTRDVIAELAETNQGIRRRATNPQENDDNTATSTGNSKSSRKHASIHSQVTGGADRPASSSSSSSADSDQNIMANAVPDPYPPKDLNPSVKLAGLLNLLADFTHNITDGLALSTSFYSSPALGATTTMAVFFHEIPHEVGDFALLIQSGFSKRNAMAAQFVTAIGAFLGTIIGIVVQEYGSGDGNAELVPGVKAGIWGTSLQWADTLLPFTAGTFLYVGTVGVIPELLENAKGSTKGQELQRTLLQFGAMAVGALIMIAISWA